MKILSVIDIGSSRHPNKTTPSSPAKIYKMHSSVINGDQSLKKSFKHSIYRISSFSLASETIDRNSISYRFFNNLCESEQIKYESFGCCLKKKYFCAYIYQQKATHWQPNIHSTIVVIGFEQCEN